jgi:hypothetical protein
MAIELGFRRTGNANFFIRQRIQALAAKLWKRSDADQSSRSESLRMHDEGGPERTGD